ncbi:MAG: hypothetical protein ABSC22_00065 [Roseiarcus sp.]|jgi:hypothetical protein
MKNRDDADKKDVSAYPLIAYVHVPKTAGTTVKKILNVCAFGGDVVDDPASFLNLARKFAWIGGHVPRDHLASGLIWIDRPIEYFSTVREPAIQLVSNLNFAWKRAGEDHYYDLHTLRQQQVDAEVMSTDFSDLAAVKSLLLRRAEYFLNTQSLYVLGADFLYISDDEFARRLATYTYVANDTDLPKLYRTFGFAQLPENVDEIRENVAKPHFDARIFDSPEMREFLAYHHRHDQRLYAAVRRASWPAEGRRPFRPAFLGGQVFTFENFDEQAYLYSNPEVAAAIKRGQFRSGRAHFEIFGYKENRMRRRWVLPTAPASEQKATAANSYASSVLERLRERRGDRARIVPELQTPDADRAKAAVPSAIT